MSDASLIPRPATEPNRVRGRFPSSTEANKFFFWTLSHSCFSKKFPSPILAGLWASHCPSTYSPANTCKWLGSLTGHYGWVKKKFKLITRKCKFVSTSQEIQWNGGNAVMEKEWALESEFLALWWINWMMLGKSEALLGLSFPTNRA